MLDEVRILHGTPQIKLEFKIRAQEHGRVVTPEKVKDVLQRFDTAVDATHITEKISIYLAGYYLWTLRAMVEKSQILYSFQALCTCAGFKKSSGNRK